MVKIAAIFGVLLLLGVGATTSAAGPFDSIQREVEQLKDDVTQSEADIADIDNQVQTTTKDIIYIYQQIDAQETALDEQRQILNGRIQEVYKNYDNLVLSMFLGARNFSDLWRRFTFLSRINRADNELLAANKFRMEKVRRLKIELAEKKRIQLELKRLKQDEYAAMREAYIVKKAALEERIEAARAEQAQMAGVERVEFVGAPIGTP